MYFEFLYMVVCFMQFIYVIEFDFQDLCVIGFGQDYYFFGYVVGCWCQVNWYEWDFVKLICVKDVGVWFIRVNNFFYKYVVFYVCL